MSEMDERLQSKGLLDLGKGFSIPSMSGLKGFH
jgi:hypothetical protein